MSLAGFESVWLSPRWFFWACDGLAVLRLVFQVGLCSFLFLAELVGSVRLSLGRLD